MSLFRLFGEKQGWSGKSHSSQFISVPYAICYIRFYLLNKYVPYHSHVNLNSANTNYHMTDGTAQTQHKRKSLYDYYYDAVVVVSRTHTKLPIAMSP